MKRVLAAVGMAGALAAPMTPASASESAAEPRPASHAALAALDCPLGKVCMWTGTGFTGLRLTSNRVTPGSCTFTGFTYRSAWNRTGYSHRLWANANCTQGSLTIPSGTAYENVGARNSLGGYP